MTVVTGETLEIEKLKKQYKDDIYKKDKYIQALESVIGVLIYSMESVDEYKAMDNAKQVAQFVLDNSCK